MFMFLGHRSGLFPFRPSTGLACVRSTTGTSALPCYLGTYEITRSIGAIRMLPHCALWPGYYVIVVFSFLFYFGWGGVLLLPTAIFFQPTLRARLPPSFRLFLPVNHMSVGVAVTCLLTHNLSPVPRTSPTTPAHVFARTRTHPAVSLPPPFFARARAHPASAIASPAASVRWASLLLWGPTRVGRVAGALQTPAEVPFTDLPLTLLLRRAD